MKILVADDHAVLCKGVRHLLTEELPRATVVEAGTAKAVLETLAADAWDLLILDLNLRDKPGFDTLTNVKRLYPRMPVLVFSLHKDDHFAVRALRAGASGFVSKSASPDELIAAVRKLLGGGKHMSETVADRLADDLLHTPAAGSNWYGALSNREFDILRALGRGKTVSEIADALSISVKTVSTYRARLLVKLRLRTTAELIRYAVEHHLL